MRDDADAKKAVQSQFGRQAEWYTVSRRHEQSPGLDILKRLAAPTAADRVLDVATGTGFTAFAMAERARTVVAVDFTAGMVRQARGLRDERHLTNVTFCLGDAEALPFRGGAFDLVVCRYASHHFPNAAHAIAEMARVVRTGGRVVVEDTTAPEHPALDELMNHWEIIRDRSHVRNIPPSGLRALFEAAGLEARAVERTAIPQHFNEWTRRSGMSKTDTEALRHEFMNASREARAEFQIAPEDGDLAFSWGEAVVLGVKR